MSKKNVKSEEIKDIKKKTAQDWMPIGDIEKSIVYRKDKSLVGILRLMPLNIDLLSNNEKRRIINSLHEVINGENEAFQIFCIGRPVDLNSYLEWLQDKLKKSDENFTRKQILKSYIQEVSEIAASGETTERRFYVIWSFRKKAGLKSEEELINKLKEMKSKFTNIGLKASICTDDEIIDLYSLFCNPVQAAYERTEINYHYATILEDD
jgi:hypothetical protein